MNDTNGQGTLPGTVAERGPLREKENYPTPPALARVGWEIARRYLLASDAGIPEREPGLKILPFWTVCEPGCGDTQPFISAAGDDPRVNRVDGFDVRPVEFALGRSPATSACITPEDWIKPSGWTLGPWSAIVTNPPFSLTEGFVRVALERVAPGGVVVMLARLSILGSDARFPFWKKHPPTEVSIIVPRPSFVAGTSDNSEYAFLVWSPSTAGQRITWSRWEKPRRGRG